MSDFKVGDKVRNKVTGDVGTVFSFPDRKHGSEYVEVAFATSKSLLSWGDEITVKSHLKVDKVEPYRPIVQLKMVAICDKCGAMFDPKQLYERIPGFNAFSPLPCDCGGRINNTANGKVIDKALNAMYASEGDD